MSGYERVTYRPEGGRSRTILLADPAVHGDVLTGIEVNRQGDEVAPRGTDERRHIIATALVTRRTPLVMDLVYGTLVEPGHQECPHGYATGPGSECPRCNA